jgi:hypothetical protein
MPRGACRLAPPAPLPPLAFDVETEGTIAIDRLLPVSLNLRYRGGGRVGFVASAGVSYLPSLDFAVTQELGIGAIGGVDGIELPTLPLEAGAHLDRLSIPLLRRVGGFETALTLGLGRRLTRNQGRAQPPAQKVRRVTSWRVRGGRTPVMLPKPLLRTTLPLAS